jgi:hypothetical protein
MLVASKHSFILEEQCGARQHREFAEARRFEQSRRRAAAATLSRHENVRV